MSHSTTSGGGRSLAAVTGDLQDFAALAQALADGAAEVGDRAVRVGAQPPRAPQVQRQRQAADFLLGCGDLLGAHRLEIHALEAFLIRHRQHRVLHRRFVLRRGALLALLLERLGDAAGRRRRAFQLLVLLRLQQRHGGGLLGGGGVAPEQGEGLVEDLLVFVAVGHHGPQRGAGFRLVAEVDPGERLLRGERLGGTDRQAGAAQQAREVHDVGCKLWGCKLWGCKLWGCKLWGCKLWGCKLWGCKLWGCKLWGCKLWGCKLWGWSLGPRGWGRAQEGSA